MKTNKLFSSPLRTGARLMILAGMLMVMLISNAAPAAAAPAALPRVGSVTVAAQSGTLTTGTPGSATYLVTVARATNQTLYANLSVTGLPAGATASFSPSPVCWSTSTFFCSSGAFGTTRTSTLTINTTAGVAAGAIPFTVQATRTFCGGCSDLAIGNGTLTIQALAQTSQTITFGGLADMTFGDADFNVSATASSGLPVSFAATDNCTVVGDLVHLTGSGSCTITASQAGDASYLPAPDVQQTFAIAPADQTITFGALADMNMGDPDFTLSATASSGLAVSYAAAGDCTVVGDLVSLISVGSCTITASQAGDANYNAAPDVAQIFAIAIGDQTITFDPLADKNFGDPDFTVSATTSSGLAVSYAAAGDCTVVGDLVSLTGVGSCMITASQAGDTNFNPAVDVAQTFAIAKGDQTITFDPLADKSISDLDFTVSATASSGLIVTFAASGDCTITGDLVQLTGVVGSCTITASQAGDTNYNPAADVDQSFMIYTAIFDLYAVTGATTFPDGATVPVWGYNSSATPVTQPGGPTLIVNEGDSVQINLFNELNENTALLLHGQDMIPDMIGVASGEVTSYNLIANRPGTYLYGAGLLPNTQHQVAMGLYGALIVRPATAGQAYDDASTAYDDEAVLVLSEIDPALNNSSDPTTFDMRKYAPRYFLINGKAYPATDAIPTVAGNRVLLRYLNAGLQFHSMALLGTHQTVIANDGSPLTYSYRMVAETFGPGQTADTIATVPTVAVDGSQFAIYDGNLMLRNSNAAGFGGMLTFLTVSGTPPIDDTTGPVTSNVAYGTGTLTATVDDSTTGGNNVIAAEYYLDSTSSTANPMTGAFGSPNVNVSASVGVPAGAHTLYVRGQDDQGNWGVFSSILVNGGDATGPATTGLTLTPNPTNGTVDVALSGTGNDSGSGNSNIIAAEYFVDATGADGSGTGMIVNVIAPIASLDATIAVAGLGEGTHPIFVHSQDAANNWGAFTQIDLVIDFTPPDTSNVNAAPNPNNGTLPINASTPAVRVTADFADTVSGLSAAEGFIDTVGANGSGFVFAANDGNFNSLAEPGYADIPLSTINLLSVGPHTIYVHAKDAAGNWGATSSTVLLIDKTQPTVSGVTAAPNPTAGAANVTLSATGNDTATAVSQAEWFTGADPGVGNGAAMTVSGTGPWNVSATIDVSTWVNNDYTLNVRVRDAAGNWSTLGSTVLTVSTPTFPGLYFSTLQNTAVPTVGGTADNADIYNWDGAAFSRVIDAAGGGSLGLPGGANVDGFDWVDATHFYMSFAGANTTVPGLGAVQDEDVVYYNNGSWSVYFDGTGFGLTNGGQDLDAINIVGSVLYFSTVGGGNANSIPGVGGPYDDADIYSWNGSNFARVWDASANSLPGNADVDGFVRVDATHFYMSFNGAAITVPGLGAVADVNVVYYDAGIWSVFFDGTAHGLVAGTGQDIDAFDIP